MSHAKDIVIENEFFELVIQNDCTAKSLLYKPNHEQCLADNKNIALFFVTEKRPCNNEIKLAYPNKRMTFNADRIRK